MMTQTEKLISKESNSPMRSKFSFIFLDKTYEGKMVFFPSKLLHEVTPFYNSDEIRVSVSGNISLYTKDYLK